MVNVLHSLASLSDTAVRLEKKNKFERDSNIAAILHN